MCKTRETYHAISSDSGTARQEHAQVHELHATHAQRGIAFNSFPILPKSFEYSFIFALILYHLPFKICNDATRTRTTAIAHTTCTLCNTSCGSFYCLFTNVTKHSSIHVTIVLNHNILYLHFILVAHIIPYKMCFVNIRDLYIIHFLNL